MNLNHPVIVFSSIEWNFTWQRHQAFSSVLANLCPQVLFIGSIPKRNPGIIEYRRVLNRLFRFSNNNPIYYVGQGKLETNIEIIRPILLPPIYPIFDLINRKLLIPLLVQRIKTLIDTSPIVLNYSPTKTVLEICQLIKPYFFIYDYIDNWHADPLTPPSIIESHIKIIQSSDLVISPSKYLADKAALSTNNVVKVIPHGVDFELFNSIYREDIVDKAKTICFFGDIGIYIDYSLLEEISHYFELILIGPRKPNSPLINNAKYFPMTPHNKLPEIIGNADVFIIPYKTSDYGKGIVPIKLFEYFATGRPVISTNLPIMEQYRDIVMIINDGQQAVSYLENIKHYENRQKRKERLEIAKKHSWEQAVESMLISLQDQIAQDL